MRAKITATADADGLDLDLEASGRPEDLLDLHAEITRFVDGVRRRHLDRLRRRLEPTEEELALRRTSVIDAIKAYRARTGRGLKESKEALDKAFGESSS